LPGTLVLAAPTATLTGPSTVRGGNTITLTFTGNGGSEGYEGVMSYDSSQATFNGITSKISSWKAENSGTKVIAYDDTLTKPITKSTTVFTLSFKVKETLAIGTTLTIQLTNVEANNGSIGTLTYSVKIQAPLSADATLKSLSVSGQTLSPSFTPSETSYSVGEIPFSSDSISVSTVCNDAGANAKVAGATGLSVGSNTVKVTVTAPSGDTKVYTITVTRQQDPDYKASTDSNLSAINLSAGILSPVFTPQVLDYIVYLPFEVTTFSATGTTVEAKASVQGVDNRTLDVGENVLELICKAEDGSYTAYRIHVMRMPAYGAEGQQNATSTPQPTAAATETPKTATNGTSRTILFVGLAFGGGLLVGVAAVFVILWFVKKKNYSKL